MDLISRAEAKAKGLKRYFNGKTCKRGHVAERTVCDYACVACGREDSRDPAVRESRREYNRLYQAGLRKRMPEHMRATLRASYARHREKRVAEAREKRAKNPGLTRAALRKSYAKLKSKRAEEMRKYRADNPGRIDALRRSYKARKRCAEGRFTLEHVERMFVEQRGLCNGCFRDLKSYHVDHIEPLSRGGTNWPENLQLLCRTCNSSKGKKTMAEWLASRA